MSIDFNKLREIAKNRMTMEPSTYDELIEWLKIWWSSTYNLPDNHPLFLDKTIEEHMIDFYIKKFQNDPKELEKKTDDELKSEQDEYEEWLKKEMGDAYTDKDSYLIDPKFESNKKQEILEQFPDIKEEF